MITRLNSDKPRVVFVSPMLTSGTKLTQYSVQAIGIAKALVSRFEPIIVTHLMNKESSEWVVLDDIPILMTHTIRIPFLTQLFYALGERFLNLNSLLESLAPDCLITTEDFSSSTQQVLMFAKKHHIPCFVYSGLQFYHGFPGGLPHFAYSKSWGKWVYREASHFIAKTKATALHLQSLGVDSKIISIIPPTIDMKLFKCDLLLTPENMNPRTLLFIGRLTKHKNPSLLLKAFHRILKAHNDVRLLMITKGGPEQGRTVKLVRELNLVGKLKVLSGITTNDLIRCYCESYLTVSSSLVEIFGMAILESLSCNTPVVSTPTAGPEDIIIPYQNGLLTREFCYEDLADKLDVILSDNKLYNRLATNARSSLIGRFDAETIGTQWLDVISHYVTN